MSDPWLFQLRMTLSPQLAAALRGDPTAAAHAPLHGILLEHDATLTCQFDAFAGYVSEAEQRGVDGYPLYEWTRQTIENPEKKAKYSLAFTVHVNDEEVYPRDVAEPLKTALSALVDPDGIQRVVMIDTNPANNPQPPARER